MITYYVEEVIQVFNLYEVHAASREEAERKVAKRIIKGFDPRKAKVRVIKHGQPTLLDDNVHDYEEERE